MTERKYPIGIQTFSEIIRNGYVYIDKTDLVWQLAHYAKFIFMSRPRRFGKSLLTSTLESYFRGERDLFEGLKIMEWEKEWEEYPVLRLDLRQQRTQVPAEGLRKDLFYILKAHTDDGYEGDQIRERQVQCSEGFIRPAYRKTGKQVVVIIDEYDAPLLDVIHEEDNLKIVKGDARVLPTTES